MCHGTSVPGRAVASVPDFVPTLFQLCSDASLLCVGIRSPSIPTDSQSRGNFTAINEGENVVIGMSWVAQRCRDDWSRQRALQGAFSVECSGTHSRPIVPSFVPTDQQSGRSEAVLPTTDFWTINDPICDRGSIQNPPRERTGIVRAGTSSQKSPEDAGVG